MARGFNQFKLVVLQAMEQGQFMYPGSVAVAVSAYPSRMMWTYLRRLWRWKLLERSQDARGRIVYRLSERGQARLAWLKAR